MTICLQILFIYYVLFILSLLKIYTQLMIESFKEIIYEQEINQLTIIFRIVVSFLFSLVIGLEREYHKQPAGLRTHVLISIGATTLMLLSIYIPQVHTNFLNGDPGRIAAQVVSGMGFLGAGAIMRFGANVKGLTTAASLWVVAAIGLAIGAGMVFTAFIGLIVVIFVLIVLDLFEKKVFLNRMLKTLILEFSSKDVNIDPDLLHHKLVVYNIDIKSIDMLKSMKHDKVIVSMMIAVPTIVNYSTLYEELSGFEHISKIELKQIL